MDSPPDLNIRVLRYFVALVEAGTYTRAAAQLHVATPSLYWPSTCCRRTIAPSA
ncbi:nitrogen assimilation transcriptional regulator [Mycobacteroides abscessus subsp. abscessus]|nr:nitrogen assimilation transcriptional regulator [Mycobacteroides abscessus subsp. abscessus]